MLTVLDCINSRVVNTGASTATIGGSTPVRDNSETLRSSKVRVCVVQGAAVMLDDAHPENPNPNTNHAHRIIGGQPIITNKCIGQQQALQQRLLRRIGCAGLVGQALSKSSPDAGEAAHSIVLVQWPRPVVPLTLWWQPVSTPPTNLVSNIRCFSCHSTNTRCIVCGAVRTLTGAPQHRLGCHGHHGRDQARH